MITPDQFQTYEPPKRIMGSEVEYTVQGEGAILRQAIIDGLLEIDVPQVAQDAGRMPLRNGGQVYIDWGSMVEIDTPECSSGYELALHEFAGHTLVKTIARHIDSPKTVHPYKRMGYAHIPKNEASAGYHENYLIGAETAIELIDRTRARRMLASYLATRPVWSGSGIVGKEFDISQKAAGIGMVTGERITEHGSKPMWMIKPAGYNCWSRLELRCTDGNMSPEITGLKFDMTSLVLRLIEHGYAHTIPVFQDPIRVLKKTSSDITFSQRYQLDNDEHMGAIEYQKEILRLSQQLAEHVQLPKSELEAIKKLSGLLDKLEEIRVKSGEFEGLDKHLDWVAKYGKILGRLGSDAVTRRDYAAVETDLRWEEISSSGYGIRHWQKHITDPQFNERKHLSRLKTPPNTRAAARARAIFARTDGLTIENHAWDKIWLNQGGVRTCELFKDPYSLESTGVS